MPTSSLIFQPISGDSEKFVENIFDNDFSISVIVMIEVLGYDDVPQKIQYLEEFISNATVFSLTDRITWKTIDLR